MAHKFLFVSKWASINDIAWQVVKEGHDVKYYTGENEDDDVADGFVPKTRDWEAEVDWADVIVFDWVAGQGTLAQKLRARGKKVIGGTSYTDRLEDDRSFGQRELQKHGVRVMPFWEFTDFDVAIDFVREHPDQYVVKPSGEAQDIKRLLFVGQEKDGDDVIRVLESYKRVWFEEVKVFQLQKRVNGVEVAVGAFFNGERFIEPINVNFEYKRLFPGDSGPSTGEMGTSMFWSKPNQIFLSTLNKMADTLKQEKYVGYIDINCIANISGVYPLEFTCRFGYPTISIQQEAMIDPIGDFFYQLASGSDIELRVKKGFQVGVCVVVPPFPFEDQKTFDSYSQDAIVVFKNGGKRNGVHIQEIKLVNDQWVITGWAGEALVVVGTGITMHDARKQAYSRIKNILIPNMYYRVDIGNRWYEEFDKLHSWGYL